MPHLALVFEDSIATLTLTNPPQNRLGTQMIGELEAALDEIARREVRAVVLRAEGPDFSFGGDIVPWPDMTERELRALFERYLQIFNKFERLPVPTIAAVQGLCFGGGFELAIRADLIFAAKGARFGHPEQSLGIVTLLGGIYRVAERAGRSRAMEWALTSEQVPAEVMERHGVVNRIVEPDQLVTAAAELARKISRGATKAHAAHKALLRAWATGGVAAADEAMFDIAMSLFGTEDVKLALPASVAAFKAGTPRPVFDFKGK